MEKNLKQFINGSKNVSLNKKERKEMRSDMFSFIEKNNVRNAVYVRHTEHGSFQFIYKVTLYRRLLFANKSKIWVNKAKTKPMALGLIVALLMSFSGTASYAAESSLPGDVLHPLKLHVNEEVRGWLVFDEEKKADWEARKTERRLEEIEELALEGGLTEEIRLKIEARFDKHVENVNERIAKFQEKENFEFASDISSRFEGSLRAHKRILARLAEENDDSNLEEFADDVEEEAENSEEEREESEEGLLKLHGPRVQAAAEGRLKALENKIEEVEKFIAERSTEADEDKLLNAQAKLDEAKELLEEGKTKMGEELYGEAFRLFQKDHRSVQRAKLILRANIDLDIDIPDDEEEEE